MQIFSDERESVMEMVEKTLRESGRRRTETPLTPHDTKRYRVAEVKGKMRIEWYEPDPNVRKK